MPIARFQMEDGRVARFEVPEGTTPEQAQTIMAAHFSQPDATVAAGKTINSIPRQLGLTARYGLEGAGEAAQIISEPIRAITDRLTGSTGRTVPAGVLAGQFADYIGLPKPETPTERTVGNATKLLAGTGATMGVGGLAQRGGELLSRVPEVAASVPFGNFLQAAKQSPRMMGELLSQAPVSQLAAASGAGLAGGASKEAGGSTGQQVLASALGGIGGAGVASLGGAAVNSAKSLKNAMMTPQQMDLRISSVLEKSGVDFSQVPERVKQSLRAELSSALKAEKELDPAAVGRLLAFKEAGLTPTRGMVSQNPVQITREMNLAKMGANSGDEGLQGLALIQNQNNAKLIGNLNGMGAANGNLGNAGNTLTSSILGRQSGLRDAEQAAWDAAKGSAGYKQPIASGVLSDINKALDSEGMMPFMNPQISKYMEAFQTGQPFTPQAYRNLQSMLSRETMKGGNEGAAASMAARILRDGELKPAGFVNPQNLPVSQGMAAGMRAADGASTEAIDAVNRARNATRQAYAFEESSPLVRSVLGDGRASDPDRIAKSFIIGGTTREAAEVVQQVGPGNIGPIKDAILAHLKKQAVNGADDEVAKFSQSAFNKALRDMGQEKLALFFSPEELKALSTNGRVAALMQSQPVGSAVNNSNSGALLLGRGLDALNKMPVLGPMFGPALKNIDASVQTRRAQNVLPGLLAEQPRPPWLSSAVGPGVAMGGLLAAPSAN